MKKFLFYVVNICLIVSLLIPSGLVEGMMNLEAGPLASSGLYRTLVTIDQAYDLTRLNDLNIKILDQGSDWASVLVSDAQLENLARLGFEPQASNEISLLVLANAESNSWLASSLSAQLDQAISFTNSVENAQINGIEADDSTLVGIIEGFSVEQLSGIQALPGVDNDADGLTDTQEAWWCTDPYNADTDSDGRMDGAEIQGVKDWMANRLPGPASDTPWASWPFNTTTCPDKDFDSIPNLAERWELGLNMDLESTDRDKFDDGQEVFGVTYCPGGDNSCGYGDLPRSSDAGYVGQTMPSWVKAPGNHPFVTAFPLPRVDVVPSSLRVETVTVVTTDHVISSGSAVNYSTSDLQGVNTSVSNSVTWNDWTEVSESFEEHVMNGTGALGFNQPNYVIPKFPVELFEGWDWLKVAKGTVKIAQMVPDVIKNDFVSAFDNVVEGVETIADANPDFVQLGSQTNTYAGDEQYDCFGENCQSYDQSLVTQQGLDTESLVRAIQGTQYAYLQTGQMISQRLYEIANILSAPTHTTTSSKGESKGGSQTTATEQYEEQTITNGESFSSEESWGTATAVDSAHAADLWFTYNVINNGTEYAREISNLTFNVFLNDDPNPIITYFVAPDLGGDGIFRNFMPNESHTYTSRRIPLSLEQMKQIDLGGTLRVVVEDFSFEVDELFFDNALNSNVQIAIEDGFEDGDQNIQKYLIPFFQGDMVNDVLMRYFPHTLDSDGEITALWTPEYRQDVPAWCREPKIIGAGVNQAVWCKHAISLTDWWNIYTSNLGDGTQPLISTPAVAGSTALFRFDADTDMDGYSNVSEIRLSTNPYNAEDFPHPELLAGINSVRAGNNVVSTLSLLNTGNYDAYGVEAVMIAPDDSITITNNTVGGSGRVKGGDEVVVGSRILAPTILDDSWSGTAKPVSGGYYTGSSDLTYTFTVSCAIPTGCSVGQHEWSLQWSDGETQGTQSFTNTYQSPDPVEIGTNGLMLSLMSGLVKNGDSFTVNTQAPRDTFQFTVNREPYTEPIVIVSYNDPMGNHRFVLPVEAMSMSSPIDDLLVFSNMMLEFPGVEIITSGPVSPGSNSLNVVVNNPSNSTLQNGGVFLKFINSQGVVVDQKMVTDDFSTGPNIVNIDWDTLGFSESLENPENYVALVYLTDYAGNILDISGRYLSNFQADPTANMETNIAGNVWNFGSAQKGSVVTTQIAFANTGFRNLSVWSGMGVPVPVAPSSSIHQLEPGEMKIITLSLDTSSLPLGSYVGSLPLRTNDPDNPTIEISITGTIVSPTGPVLASGDPYRPLTENLYVNGPLAGNTIATYSNAAEVNSGSEPVVFTDGSGAILGKGEPFIGLDDGTIPLVTTGFDPMVDYLAADNLDLTGAIELEEYRTDFSRVYVWPDGRGVVVPTSSIATDGNQLNDGASSGRYYDTYVNSYYPSTVTWDQAALYVGNFSAAYKTNARILIWFHLPTLPQYAVIDSANIALTAYTDQGDDIINTRVFRITESWSQTSTSPTWNNHPPVDWGTVWSSTDIVKTNGPKYWNVTALTTAWYSGTPNYGVVIQANPQGANGVVFRSAESGVDVPQLYVTFHIPPPPNAPTLYTISNADGDGAYSVDWSDVANTTSYSLEESFNSGAWNLIMNTASSIYNASGRYAGEWCYRVKANNAYGSSAWSGTQCAIVNPAPGTPAIATIDNTDGDSNYLVDWNDIPYAISYELQENHDAGTFATVYSGATSAFSISGRSSGQWCYRAKAINPSGSSGWSSTQCAMVNTPPDVPIPLLPVDAVGLLGRAVTFSWQESSDPDNFPGTPMKYHVEVTYSTGGGTQISEWTTNTQITMVLPEDGEYSWRVEASDNISTSGWSNSRTLSVFSIERANAEQVRIALPESVETFENYKVLYGLPALFPTAITPAMVFLELPKRLYSSVTLGVLVNESINENATFTVDIAADGSIDWSQNIVWSAPAFFESPDLTAAINAYMAQSSSAGGELVSIPISVNHSSIGELYIMGVEAYTGVDSDPRLGTGDLIISNTDPMETDVISLTARVHNGGIFTAKNIMVNFFAGDPAYGGRYIGSRLVSNILAGSYGDAVLNWDTSGYVGDHEIFAVADYGAQIPEMDETNNTTSLSLTIRKRPDLSVTLISLSDDEPVVGESVTLTISESNLGESDAASSLVSVYVGDTVDSGILLGENFVEVMRGSTTNVNFTWVPDRTGWHRLHVLSDANDQVFEFDESNNQNWLDVYIGLAGPLLLDSGTDLDPVYSVETGYGYIDINQPDELVSCSVNNLPEETLRRDPDGKIVYQFDHLLPGHFYHLDITLFECDGAGRQEMVLVDGNQISEVEDLGDGQVHRLSLRLDPALYGDRTISVEIQAEGIDGAVVSEVNLHDIDYRYADSGGNRDPQYPSDEGYGWVDGSPVLTWGTLPYQSVRVDQSDNTLNYQFDNLSPNKLYNVHFTFWQPSGTGRIQKVEVDGIDTGLSVNTGDYLRHQEMIAIPLSAYSSDGMAVISIVRTNATSGAMVNEIALEEETVFTNTSCVVQPTPYFSETYGSVLISGANAPVGSVVQALNPRGETVGCFAVTDEGLYGFMRIYGEDSSAVPAIPGMRNGEIVSYSVNGAPAVALPLFYWSDDHAVHGVNLNAGNVSSQSILLQPGWNLISFNVEPPAPMVSSVLQSVASRYDRVLGENGIYVPSLPPEFNTLKELHSATGYYLRVTGTTSVSLLIEGIAQACSEPKMLHVGWNWIGGPCGVTATAAALVSIEGHYQRVLSLNKTYDPALPAFSTLKSLIPGEGYLIYIIDPVTLIYPDVAMNLDKVDEVAEDSCSRVPATPFSTLAYGYIQINTDLAAEGSLVEFITPRGEVAGCSLVAAGGLLPLTQIYGADGENIGGFLEGEEIFVRVDGIAVGGPLDFTWQDDKTPHELSINITIHKISLPLITH